MIHPRFRAFLQFALLGAVLLLLFLLFPAAFRFAQVATMELRYLWWLILLLALGIWLIWGVKKKP